MHWCVIVRIMFLFSMIPQSYSSNVRTLSSLGFMTPVIPACPSALAHPILWRPPNKGITLVEVFRGIETELVAVFEAGLTVRWYVSVDNNQVSTYALCHHLHQLMVLCPQQLHPTAIRGCFACLPHDVTLIGEANSGHLGLMDMVIARWPCQVPCWSKPRPKGFQM